SPRRLYLNETAPAQTPSNREGTWTSIAGAQSAQMSPVREGTVTETTVTTPSCNDGEQFLVNTFVSTPLTATRMFGPSEQIRVVIGSHQAESNDALQPVATLWVMDSSGTERCTIRTDWQLGTSL